MRRVFELAVVAFVAACASTGSIAGEGRGGGDGEAPFASSRANEWVTIRDFRYVTSVAASQTLAFFGTTGGVERLDTLRDRWMAPVTSADGLPDDRVTALVAEPTSGDLWIGTARGLARLQAFLEVVEPAFGPPPFRVDRLLLDPGDGTVWAQVGGLWWTGPHGSPVLERSDGPTSFERLIGSVPVDEVDPSRLPWTDPLWVDSPLMFGARFRLTALDRDRRGDWYVGTWGDNGRRWASSRQDWEALHFGLAGPAGGPIAGASGGYWFLPSAAPDARRTRDVSLAPGRVRLGFEAGSQGPDAVARASRDLAVWSYDVPVEVEGLPAAAAHAAVAAGDTVWLATDQGLVRGVKGVWERWGDATGPAYAVALEPLLVWVGGEDGLSAIDRRDRSLAARFPSGRVVALALTSEAVYAGTSSGLLAGRRSASAGEMSLPTTVERVGSRAGSIRAIAATDTLLLVAGATGLEVFDRRGGTWAPEPRAAETSALAVDAEGQVWIGSARGLARWRPATGEWDEWTPRDGLAGLPVLHLLAEDGVVWASTPAGASRFAWREAGR